MVDNANQTFPQSVTVTLEDIAKAIQLYKQLREDIKYLHPSLISIIKELL